MFLARKKQYIARKYIKKRIENAMLFLSQSAGRSPPIGFSLRDIRAAYRPPFSQNTSTFPDRRKEVTLWRYFALRKPATTR